MHYKTVSFKVSGDVTYRIVNAVCNELDIDNGYMIAADKLLRDAREDNKPAVLVYYVYHDALYAFDTGDFHSSMRPGNNFVAASEFEFYAILREIKNGNPSDN